MRAIITVLGKDHQGIIYSVTKIVAEYGGNVLDISQTIMSDNIFAMMMLVDITELNGEFPTFVDDLKALGEKDGYSIHVQREDVFNAMHRI